MTHEQGPELPVPIISTSIGDFLFPSPAERRTGAIVRWWESRRLAFNLIVGGSGVVSLALVALGSVLPPNAPGFRIVLLPIVVYGVLANLCYSMGAAIEILLDKIWGRELLPAGPSLFRAGLTFSVGLTLVFPTIIVIIGWVLRVLGVVG
jgi:hypothetical protein